MQNNVNSNLDMRDILSQVWAKYYNFKILCTKYMASSEVMTSSTHSFAYSYRLVKKCFVKICETSKCHNFLIFQPIFIRFSLLRLIFFTLSCKLKVNLLWSSSLGLDFIHPMIRPSRSYQCLPPPPPQLPWTLYVCIYKSMQIMHFSLRLVCWKLR